MISNDILADISRLTTIQESSLNHFSDVAVQCISHTIAEAKSNNEHECEFSIGIGVIHVDYDDEDVTLTFSPSKKLEDALVKSINEDEDLLVNEVESVLKNRVMRVYKELI